jgi:hypothetical protein
VGKLWQEIQRLEEVKRANMQQLALFRKPHYLAAL